MDFPRLPLIAPFLLLVAAGPLAGADNTGALPPGHDSYAFRSVVIGGGGFVTGIIFNPTEKGLVYARTDVGGAYRRDARSGAQWIPLLDWAGQTDWNLYGVESLATDPVDPRRVYIAAGTYTNPRVSNGELLRSKDYGKTWDRTPLRFKFGGNEAGRNNGERLAVDPNDDSVVLLGTRQDGLWRSTDFGVTWARLDGFPDFNEMLPERLANTHVYIPQHAGINVVRFDPRSGKRGTPTPVIYATASTPNASVFRSTDAGTSWSPVAGQPLGLRPIRTALSPTGILYVCYGKESGPNTMTDGAVWKLDAISGAWTDITPERPSAAVPFGYASVSIDPVHPETLVVGTWNHWAPLDEIFRSRDAGATWQPILGQARWDHTSAPYTNSMNRHWLADVEIDPFDASHALFTTGFGVWETRDLAGADAGRPTTWSFNDSGIEETVPLVLVSPPEGPHLLSGVGDVDGFRHDDLDATPKGRFGTPPYKNTASIAFSWEHPNVVVRSGNTYKNDQTTGAYSSDGGATWAAFPSEPPGTVGPYWRGEGQVAISADAKTIVWSPTGVAPNYTTDFGKTWFPSVGVTVNLAVAADTVNSSKFYAYDTESGSIVVSRDGARSFKAAGTGLPTEKGRWGPAPGKLSCTPGLDGDFWVIAGGALLHSKDSGKTLQAQDNVTASSVGFGKAAPGAPSAAVFIVGNVAGVEGLFRSDDAGITWKRINDSAHGYGQIRAISGDPRIFGRVYFGTGGRGIVYGDRTAKP